MGKRISTKKVVVSKIKKTNSMSATIEEGKSFMNFKRGAKISKTRPSNRVKKSPKKVELPKIKVKRPVKKARKAKPARKIPLPVKPAKKSRPAKKYLGIKPPALPLTGASSIFKTSAAAKKSSGPLFGGSIFSSGGSHPGPAL